MYYRSDYYDFYDEDQLMKDHFEKEMHKQREEAIQTLSSVVHSKSSEITNDFALMFAYSYFESMPSAEKIADQLNLTRLDFLAIVEDLDSYIELYKKEEDLYRNIGDL